MPWTCEVNQSYLEDASGFQGHADQVFVPHHESEVAEILREASASRVPVTVAGAGTGVTGARVPTGGWVLSLEKFSRLDVDGNIALAGAGVLLRDLHDVAAVTGQFYPPDPTETAASVGGTIATNASGARSFRYGGTRRYVRALQVVLADGTIREFRRGQKVDFETGPIPIPKTTKHTAGYFLRPGMDWVDLFIGSEGTLGVITRAELQLLPAPPTLLGGVVFFDSDDSALDAVEHWRSDRSIRMLEYLDEGSLAMLHRTGGAAILFEQELASEDDPVLDAWNERLAESTENWFAFSARDRESFREFRHALPERVNDTVRLNGFMKLGSDYAVPFERNREMLAFYRDRLEEHFQGRYVIFGHIGDAHLHVNILPASQTDMALGNSLMLDFARQAVALGGTVSAEHGLGKRKAHLLPLQYGPADLDRMKAVKRRLDPQWILGQGTLWR
ncbi:MAG: FAD-binding oxidoreductase [Bryobacteraceae bacterium]